MPRQHTGRPGSTPIHRDFVDAHRAIAEGTHTATCTIRKPGGAKSGLNQATGRRIIATNAPYYNGPCGYTRPPTSPASNVQAGDEASPVVDVVVTLPWDAAPQLQTGDTVTITSPGEHGDPELVGLVVVVGGIEHDSFAWERVLRCTHNQAPTT